MTTVLKAQGITKQYPGVLANDNVDFSLKMGEIHALLGENGAGKTTLMNVFYGLTQPNSGKITINDKEVPLHSPQDAIERGIGMVHQHFMLIPVFSVSENIMLGAETVRGLTLDRKQVAKRVRELSHQFGLDVDPEALIKELPVGIQQRVEIVKALYRNATILILDEPTAVLTPQEAMDLFRIMRQLTKQGVSIIFITHKLKEVMEVADRITVMRDGKVVGSVCPEETDESHLAAMMVGRNVILEVKKSAAQPEEKVLEIEHATVKDKRGLDIVEDVSFSVRAGEVLGIAGVQGNGQTELIEALCGLRKLQSGKIIIGNTHITDLSPRNLIENGMAHVPEDRQRHGLVLQYPVADNLILCTYYQNPFSRRHVLQVNAIDRNARSLIDRFDIRTPSPYINAGKLSGGNQQKVIVAREFSRPIRLLVANQPTRGLDVGSIEYIHQQIITMRDEGVAVLLVSAELDEILALADRIVVMFRGRIVAELQAELATREELGLLMAGSAKEKILGQ